MHQVLLIGCGAIAGGYDSDRPAGASPLTHAGAFTRDTRFAVAACIDPDEARREAFARRWAVPHHAAAIADLGTQAGAFDVISICSPTAFHASHLEAALALKPRLIFCEKPVAERAGDTARMIRDCERAGVSLAVNHTRRWAPDLVQLAQDLRADRYGAVLSAVGHYGKGVIHNGGHLLDLLQMLLGEPELVAVGRPTYDHWDTDPSVPALLHTRDGASVHLVAGDARAFTQFELVLTTQRGEIAMRDGGARIETRSVIESKTFAGYRTLGSAVSVDGRYEEAMTRAVDNIAGRLENGAALASTGYNALAAQEICEAILQASTDHQSRESRNT